MGKIVYVVGKSGTGKSTSIRTLSPEETYIINVTGKDLPFKGSSKLYRLKGDDYKGNLYNSNDYNAIIKIISAISERRPEIKSLIIDDFNYVISKQVFDSAAIKGYDKFTLMAKNINEIMQAVQNARNDLYVFIMWHTELADDGTTKLKTAGKMIDNYINPEGLATIVLHTTVKDKGYSFITQHDGHHFAKSPDGLFKSDVIDNDLQLVIDQMNAYYFEN